MRLSEAGSGREAGQALLMALAFITFVGVVGVALLSYATTNLHATSVLRQLRSEEYSGDAAVDEAITVFRNNTGQPCGANAIRPPVLNQQSVVLNCSPNGALDVTFTAACPTPGTRACPSGAPIVVARVTFTGAAPTVAANVLTWSVLR